MGESSHSPGPRKDMLSGETPPLGGAKEAAGVSWDQRPPLCWSLPRFSPSTAAGARPGSSKLRAGAAVLGVANGRPALALCWTVSWLSGLGRRNGPSPQRETALSARVPGRPQPRLLRLFRCPAPSWVSGARGGLLFPAPDLDPLSSHGLQMPLSILPSCPRHPHGPTGQSSCVGTGPGWGPGPVQERPGHRPPTPVSQLCWAHPGRPVPGQRVHCCSSDCSSPLAPTPAGLVCGGGAGTGWHRQLWTSSPVGTVHVRESVHLLVGWRQPTAGQGGAGPGSPPSPRSAPRAPPPHPPGRARGTPGGSGRSGWDNRTGPPGRGRS